MSSETEGAYIIYNDCFDAQAYYIFTYSVHKKPLELTPNPIAVDFYTTYNPSKLDGIDEMLNKYRGLVRAEHEFYSIYCFFS